jgi:hypothetical protein
VLGLGIDMPNVMTEMRDIALRRISSQYFYQFMDELISLVFPLLFQQGLDGLRNDQHILLVAKEVTMNGIVQLKVF